MTDTEVEVRSNPVIAAKLAVVQCHMSWMAEFVEVWHIVVSVPVERSWVDTVDLVEPIGCCNCT